MADETLFLTNDVERLGASLRQSFRLPEEDAEMARLLTLLEDSHPETRCADNQNHWSSSHGQLTKTS